MIVCHAYPLDDNDGLKFVQHELYPRSVAQVYAAARTALLWADEVLEARRLIAEKARATVSFDHRVLQDAHDILAAAFRHASDDGGQLRLWESEADRADRYRTEWQAWLTEELGALAKSARFVRSTVQAVLLAHTDLGHAAEHDVCELLVVRYGLHEWGRADGYGATYRSRGGVAEPQRPASPDSMT